jgi:hypothetical protein
LGFLSACRGFSYPAVSLKRKRNKSDSPRALLGKKHSEQLKNACLLACFRNWYQTEEPISKHLSSQKRKQRKDAGQARLTDLKK